MSGYFSGSESLEMKKYLKQFCAFPSEVRPVALPQVVELRHYEASSGYGKEAGRNGKISIIFSVKKHIAVTSSNVLL
eukprot:ANDGO_07202.mRNA.1 hypothetical protein